MADCTPTTSRFHNLGDGALADEIGRVDGISKAADTMAPNAPTSEADERALSLWDRWHEQKERSEYLGRSSCSNEKANAAVGVLVSIEGLLEADIGASANALAAILMIERGEEAVSGLHRAALAAIRPQLVGAIAEAADRVLAQEDEEASA